MKGRGLSNIVITVLVVLVSLIAIGIIWAFMAPIFQRGGETFQAQATCAEVSVEPQRCLVKPGEGIIDPEGSGNNLNLVEVIVSVMQGTAEGFITTVEYSDATFVTKALQDVSVNTYETRLLLFDDSPTNVYPVRARVAATVKTESGEVIPCPESSVTVMCGVSGIGGDSGCYSDADCNSTQLRCVDGVCTFYEDRECYADSDCSTGFKCDSGGHCYRVGSPGGGGGGGGGGGCADADGDGYSNHECGGYDCNDGNANVNPGTNEICGNGVDDDCDGETDMDDSECAGVTCTDTDGDGYGYPGGDSSCLNGPEEDCNDDNKYQHPNQIWFFDRDKDNYTLASGVSMVGCVSPDPLYNLPSEQRLGVDCDDYKNTIHPGAIEVCNLKNDDCDLEVDEGGCPVSPSGSVCNEDYSRKCSPGPPDDTYKHYPPADYGFGCNPPDKYCYIKSGLTCEGGLGDVCMRASCGDPSLHVVAGDPDCQALYSADYFCCNVDPR